MKTRAERLAHDFEGRRAHFSDIVARTRSQIDAAFAARAAVGDLNEIARGVLLAASLLVEREDAGKRSKAPQWMRDEVERMRAQWSELVEAVRKLDKRYSG